MKKRQYSNEQVGRILQEVDKDALFALAKQHGVSEQIIFGERPYSAPLQSAHPWFLENHFGSLSPYCFDFRVTCRNPLG